MRLRPGYASGVPQAASRSYLNAHRGGDIRSAGPPHRQPLVVADRTLTATPVFETYWRFAAARQALYLSRLADNPPPWTDDPVLCQYRFTNVYRASDRVSQYLISHVIYGADEGFDEADIVFRVLLFKLFNKISTWERLERDFGEITWASFHFDRYSAALDRVAAVGPVYSGAYMMPPPQFGERRKYANHLRLLEHIMQSPLPNVVAAARSLRDVYHVLRTFPTVGRFLAFQFTIDLNYTPLMNISEDDYVVAGPGACDGIRKCFGVAASGIEEDVIRNMVQKQEFYFRGLGLRFDGLFGRRLHLIDCQNLFCEVDKYARVAHPGVRGISGRSRIKRKFHPTLAPMTRVFPPGWKLSQA